MLIFLSSLDLLIMQSILYILKKKHQYTLNLNSACIGVFAIIGIRMI